MGAFDYTQKPFWQGVWYPYWSLIVISVLGGLIGLDHWWLRSPVSGVLKFFGNILTLGLWYFYDILQIVSEPDNVKQYGLSMPFFGPLGIGAGMFKDTDPSGPEAKAPFRYFGYVLLTLLPFGFDYFLAGDTMGAAARFLTSIFFLLWPIGFIWGCVNTFRAVFMPKHLFTKGTYRMFPFSLFMDTYGPSKLGPVDLGPEEDECSQKPSGFFGYIWSWLSTIFGSAINVILPGLAPASAAVGAAVQAGATTAKVAANSASAVIQAATTPTVAAVGTASSIAQKVPSAIAAIPAAAATASSGLAAATTPEALKSLAQKGGGFARVDMTNIALFAVFTVVVGGGSLLALQRVLNLNGIQLFKQKEETNGEKSDSPPEPRGIRSNAASAPRN